MMKYDVPTPRKGDKIDGQTGIRLARETCLMDRILSSTQLEFIFNLRILRAFS